MRDNQFWFMLEESPLQAIKKVVVQEWTHITGIYRSQTNIYDREPFYYNS